MPGRFSFLADYERMGQEAAAPGEVGQGAGARGADQRGAGVAFDVVDAEEVTAGPGKDGMGEKLRLLRPPVQRTSRQRQHSQLVAPLMIAGKSDPVIIQPGRQDIVRRAKVQNLRRLTPDHRH